MRNLEKKMLKKIVIAKKIKNNNLENEHATV